MGYQKLSKMILSCLKSITYTGWGKFLKNFKEHLSFKTKFVGKKNVMASCKLQCIPVANLTFFTLY